MIRSRAKSTDSANYFSTDHLKLGLKGRALRGGGATIAAQLCGLAIQTIGTIVLARLLRPSDFGLLTMVLIFSLLLGNFGVNGFTEAVMQVKEVNHKQMSTLFWINLSIQAILAIFFVASAPIIVWFYKEPRLTSIIIAIAASNVIGALSVQHLALLKRRMQFYRISGNEVTASAVSVAVPIVLAGWWHWGYWALVAKWVIPSLMITGGAWVLCGWRPGLPARHAGVGPMVRYAFHTYGNFVLSYLRRNIDKMLIGRYYGSQPLGYYDRAYHLSSMLPEQLISPIYSVAVSAFSRLSDDAERYRQSYLNLISILAFVGMPSGAALTLISDDLIRLLLGPQWSKSGQIFFAFGISIGVMIVYRTHGWLHLSLGKPDRWLRWGIVEFIVTALCFAIGLPYGAIGVAVAFSASFYILIFPALWYAGKPIHLKLSSVLSGIWKYYVSALAAALVCWFVLHKVESISNIFIELNIFIRIIASLVLFTMVYLPLVVVLYQSMKPISQFISILRETALQTL